MSGLRWRLVVGVAAFVAACGSPQAAPRDAGSRTGSTDAVAASTDDGANSTAPSSAPTTTEDVPVSPLEQRWAEQRAAIVERAEAEGWGIGADNVLRGPGGLEVDLSECPSEWDPHAGITETSAKLAFVGSPDGSGFQLPDYHLAVAMGEARVERINDAGGVGGRDLELVIVQNGTPGTLGRLLGAPDALGVLSVENDAIRLAPSLKDRCVPLLLPWSNRGDVGAGDWAVTYGPSAGAEAALLGQALSDLLAEGDVAPPFRLAIVFDNADEAVESPSDFFRLYRDAFGQWADGRPDVVSNVASIPIEMPPGLGDPDVYRNVTADLLAADPDIVVVLGSYSTCSQIFGGGELRGLDLVAGLSPTCALAMQLEQWEVSTNWYSVQSLDRYFNERDVAEEWIDYVNNEVALDGHRTDVGPLNQIGVNYGWLQLQVLRLAHELPGGLSRTNLLLAMWAADFEHPGFPAGVRWTVNGPADPMGEETVIVERWGPGQSEPERVGMFSNEGASPRCSWDGERCTYGE